jgi:hypothetical protein
VKFKAVLVMLAAAALSLGAAGSAAAQPRGPVRPPQVNGAQLQAALLPISAFGSGFNFDSSLNTGSKLATTHPKYQVHSLSCDDWEIKIYSGLLGDTAGADTAFSNPSPRSTYPDSIVGGWEDVLQFANTATAVSIYDQARAKFSACHSFSYVVSGQADLVETLSVANTTIGGNRAFLVTERVTAAHYYPEYHLYLYVLAGTNVYSLVEINGNSDEPSSTLMADLIHRVQALYPHK